MQRPKQTDCKNEPSYPGLEGIVCLALSAPDMTIHLISKRCNKDWPHLITECGEF